MVETPSSGILRETSHEAENQLDTGHLGRVPLVSLSLASFTPAVGMALVPILLLSIAGPTAWSSALLSALLVICVGVSVITFARRYVGTGSLYSYIGEVFGAWARYIVAGGLLCGFVIQIGALSSVTGIFGGSFLYSRGLTGALGTGSQMGFTAAAIVIATLIAYRGIDTSVRVAVTLAVLSIPLMVVITVASVSQTGLDLSAQFSSSAFSLSGTVQGVAAGAAWLVGFESCTSLTAETKDPRKNIPLAVMAVPVVLGILYVACTILQVPGLLASTAEIEAGMSAPAALALSAGLGSGVAEATDVVLAIATMAALIAFVNYGARCALALGEDGLLPAWTTKVHTRFRSPSTAIVAMAALGYASITVLLLVGGDILTAYSMAAPLIVYCWIAPYVLISLGALVLAKREGLLSTGIVVAAVVGGFGMAWVYLNGWIYPPTSPTDAMVWVAVVIVALAAVGVAVRHRMSGQRRVG